MSSSLTSGTLLAELDSVAAIADAVRRREVSTLELTSASLEQAEQDAERLGSFTAVLHERALARAKAIDRDLRRGLPVGALAGVPASVKDAIWLAGAPATNGSLACRDFVPDRSSGSVVRLEQAGAVIVGKTNNPEFCLFGYTDGPLLGPARNPFDPALTAGGSSGGAAASVATGATRLALGNDGGGSIRGPASFCGTFGLKPSFGLVPNQPSLRIWPTLSVDGPITATALDAALMLSALAGLDPLDDATVDVAPRDYVSAAGAPDRLVEGAAIAWSTDLGYAAVDPSVRAVFEEQIARLTAAGLAVVEDHPRAPDPTPIWTEIAVCEGFASLGHFLAEWESHMWPGVADILRAGDRPAASYLRAQQRRSEFSRAWAEFFERYDVLLTPMMQVPPFAVGCTGPKEIDGRPVDPFFDDWSNLCYAANLTGQPAASVPIGFTEGPLPVGMQILAGRFRDELALAMGAVVQRLQPPLPAPELTRAMPAPTSNASAGPLTKEEREKHV